MFYFPGRRTISDAGIAVTIRELQQGAPEEITTYTGDRKHNYPYNQSFLMEMKRKKIAENKNDTASCMSCWCSFCLS